MGDQIQQHITATDGSYVTVIGKQESHAAACQIVPIDQVLRLSAEQCSATRRRIGNKYRSSLYIRRDQDSTILNFINAPKRRSASALILTERAGSGKTNLLCMLSQQLPAMGFPTAFLLGSDFIRDPYQLRDEAISVLGITSPQRTIPQQNIDAFLRTLNKPFCILIDAMNEARDLELLKQSLLGNRSRGLPPIF